MSLSDMAVFNQYFMPAIAETYAQEINKFNGASAGTLTLSSEGFDGDYLQESFYKEIFALVVVLTATLLTHSQTATPLLQAQMNKVKVAGGFGPVLFEPSQMTWLRKPTQEGITIACKSVCTVFDG